MFRNFARPLVLALVVVVLSVTTSRAQTSVSVEVGTPSAPKSTFRISIRTCLRTAIGSRIRPTVGAGRPMTCPPTGGPTPTATGSTPTTAGAGFRTSRGVGPPITTGAGSSATRTAGRGCPAPSGRRHGSRGARTMITWAGRRCRPLPSGTLARPRVFQCGRDRPGRVVLRAPGELARREHPPAGDLGRPQRHACFSTPATRRTTRCGAGAPPTSASTSLGSRPRSGGPWRA